MECNTSTRRSVSSSRTPFIYCCWLSTCLFCICLLFCCTAVHLDTRSSSLQQTTSYIQGIERLKKEDDNNRRYLNGLGSFPPRCKSKCGKCTPCTPVHVPVPPGTSAPTEYYPEAWRCKCKNKLYMP